jgi:hypothetical protein
MEKAIVFYNASKSKLFKSPIVGSYFNSSDKATLNKQLIDADLLNSLTFHLGNGIILKNMV